MYRDLAMYGLHACDGCGAVVREEDRDKHTGWHAEMAAHSHATLSVIGGPLPAEDDSVFRSGGQTKDFGPRPRIATARPELT